MLVQKGKRNQRRVNDSRNQRDNLKSGKQKDIAKTSNPHIRASENQGKLNANLNGSCFNMLVIEEENNTEGHETKYEKDPILGQLVALSRLAGLAKILSRKERVPSESLPTAHMHANIVKAGMEVAL